MCCLYILITGSNVGAFPFRIILSQSREGKCSSGRRHVELGGRLLVLPRDEEQVRVRSTKSVPVPDAEGLDRRSHRQLLRRRQADVRAAAEAACSSGYGSSDPRSGRVLTRP